MNDDHFAAHAAHTAQSLNVVCSNEQAWCDLMAQNFKIDTGIDLGKIWVILLAALALRVAWALLIPVIPVSDSSAYDIMARTLAEHWPLALLAPVLSTASYQLMLWSIAQAPVAFVISLRETSLLFALAIGALLLGERVGAWRWLAVGVVAAGVVAIRVASA